VIELIDVFSPLRKAGKFIIFAASVQAVYPDSIRNYALLTRWAELILPLWRRASVVESVRARAFFLKLVHHEAPLLGSKNPPLSTYHQQDQTRPIQSP